MLFVTPIKSERCAVLRHFFIHVFCLLALALSASLAYAGNKPLTLSEALSRAMAQNPTLQVFDFRLQGLEGRRFSADQNPALEAGLEVENVLGNGNRQGSDAAEYTLSLSSVLELGGKRQARVSVVDSRYGLVEAERRAETLDVLGQVAQRFVATLALQEKLELAAEAVALAEATHEIVTRRVDRGASPQAEVMRAKAALTRSRIEQSRALSEYESRKIALASLWGDTRLDFQSLEGDLFQFGSSDSFEILYQRVSESPAIQIYASERRVREAEVQLSRSQSESDIRWQVGIRRFEETDDTALTAGLSVPLFSGRRNRGEVQAALAARDEVQYRREDTLLRLHSRLFEAYRQRQQNIEAVEQIRGQMLPDLSDALSQTREAYQKGRYSYVEWTAAQRELLSARQALVDAATMALLNQALIEQLTAQPLAGR
ncbi:MAG: cobalt-zinc-cadmium efflux system outer membrane protein [Porticoccus sp.]|jgi:cobalt-zinc-cadmium efflux system outer membrane protein|uniref:TolC family protein n=1 Tax=Cellvibrionales TaxID=1706369 RepID=UPI00062DDD6E|nr:TolC family protein [Spongiibacter sp. IMCC21906]AKH70615.1 outer membrane protein [Spongiibacter sp. IMCC21906]